MPSSFRVYLIAVLLIGLHYARRQTTTETYFVAKRSIPSWALGISMLATIISAVTFIAYPGAGYAGNWSLLVPGIMVVVVLLLVGAVVIPFYRQAVGVSTYEYFEKRFGYPLGYMDPWPLRSEPSPRWHLWSIS